MRHGITTRVVGVSVLDPSYAGFVFPIRWRGDYRVNGEIASPSTFFTPCGLNAFHSLCDGIEILAVFLKKSRFVEAVAALRGKGPEDVTLQGGAHTLAPEILGKLRRRLGAILHSNRSEREQRLSSARAEEFRKQALQVATDAYLFSDSESEAKTYGFLKSNRVFRKAEECFEAAGQSRISLVDLCKAAGVSKSSLYQAFYDVCGEPPIGYFYKRRMMKARSTLIHSAHERGAVKRAALDAGFTEIGRFSVEYRRIFGESPSFTLTESRL